jgi:hypothetical protein
MLIIIIALSLIAQLFVGIPVIFLNMYKDKDFKSLMYMALLLFSLVLSILCRILDLTGNFFGILFMTVVTFGLAGVGVVGILSRVKERKTYTLLPFGPALVLGGFIVLFFGSNVSSWFISNFGSHLLI